MKSDQAGTGTQISVTVCRAFANQVIMFANIFPRVL
jgi:hypothetical protein